MIELLSDSDYRDQFIDIKFPARCSIFIPVIIEFSIERSIIWDISDWCSERDQFIEICYADRDGNSIEINFNAENYANSIDCWIFYPGAPLGFEINTVEQFQEFLTNYI